MSFDYKSKRLYRKLWAHAYICIYVLEILDVKNVLLAIRPSFARVVSLSSFSLLLESISLLLRAQARILSPSARPRYQWSTSSAYDEVGSDSLVSEAI